MKMSSYGSGIERKLLMWSRDQRDCKRLWKLRWKISSELPTDSFRMKKTRWEKEESLKSFWLIFDWNKSEKKSSYENISGTPLRVCPDYTPFLLSLPSDVEWTFPWLSKASLFRNPISGLFFVLFHSLQSTTLANFTARFQRVWEPFTLRCWLTYQRPNTENSVNWVEMMKIFSRERYKRGTPAEQPLTLSGKLWVTSTQKMLLSILTISLLILFSFTSAVIPLPKQILKWDS